MNVQVSADAAEAVVSKSEFARLIGVSAARVSQYIGEEKISGDALVGEGRNARIRVEMAKAQLRQHLDIGQRLGNGLDTRLDAALPLAPPATDPAPGAPPAASAPAVDPVEDKLKRAKLEAAERANREAAIKEAASAGRYVLADAMRRELGRAQAQTIAWFEGVLTELANAVASKHAIPQRDVLHLLRNEFRAARERGAAKFQAAAESMPALVNDETVEPDGEDEMEAA